MSNDLVGDVRLPAIWTRPLTKSRGNFLTDGDKLIELVRIAWKSPEQPEGLELDDWQKWLLRHMLERYPANHPRYPGQLRYRQVVVSMGRQNGKSLLGAILGVYGLLLHQQGANVISLASSTDQARIIYSRVLFTIQNNEYLKKRFKKATEQRGITTLDGSGRYDVKAAKESALQGIPMSLCLFDELHLAKKGMWSAAVLGTAQKKDGMVIGITTAGDQSSETLLDLYKLGTAAAQGDDELERFGFFCWQAPDGSQVDDPTALKRANPSIDAGRLDLNTVLSDIRSIPEHEARRYRLNQFIQGTAQSWLPSDVFAKSAGDGITEQQNVILAVDRTKNWEYATIAAARKCDDGSYETELVQGFAGATEQQLYVTLRDLYARGNIQGIAMDDRQMPNLAKRLKMDGLPVWQLWTKEISSACSTVYAMFTAGNVKHRNDPLLQLQSPKGIAKYAGETWFISRRDSLGDIDALMATVMALYVSATHQNFELQVF
jgi:phage terminase large subunit-like protein